MEPEKWSWWSIKYIVLITTEFLPSSAYSKSSFGLKNETVSRIVASGLKKKNKV